MKNSLLISSSIVILLLTALIVLIGGFGCNRYQPLEITDIKTLDYCEDILVISYTTSESCRSTMSFIKDNGDIIEMDEPEPEYSTLHLVIAPMYDDIVGYNIVSVAEDNCTEVNSVYFNVYDLTN